ncbi:glycosyltransferase family 4 protein [Francisella tularensis]|uniref:glycosyltransferase family 4 protein n=1 Tax=Francisella tularensis TaxID=263 RepID=UPI000173E4C4|nr:glycosyltransferase family 4 protein [Francisella tularensis]ACD30810.1 glycosyl transferase group 1 family protein [Francisella tularensis subsp. mediasiatica FSC147]MBK2078120.1 glycosyltransferase family 4 protein [Francisella tularensis subsp. mediasiatica]MBK2101358.1 glycosyltransferase family 4 protein [Francisella tularensis subsp. mediasiatica]MBK2104313.1 glycosyltransferase family 4 protein [Francisella tularensis subsp. mediasiatica]MDN9003214.1 glycosyltransferase family 4 prot
METKNIKDVDVIALSLGRRFSGINASMLAVIPEQNKLVDIVAMGFNIDSKEIRKIRFRDFLFGCWRDKWRIWHARRNIDMLIGIILKYLFRYKIILVFTSVAQRHHKKLTKFYINRMEAVICPSEISAKYLEKKPYIVPHGVVTQVFYPAENRQQQWQDKKIPGKYGIGIFGRIRKTKGTQEFIEAAIVTLKKYPDWTAVVIGEATPRDLDFKKELEQKVKQAGLDKQIIFIGFIADSNEIPSWYRALDIVVCASHKEGFGLPALEAMASKCAVIVTKAGAWPEIIVDDENGYLVEPKSSQQIADKLDMLISDSKLRYKIAQNGYDLVTTKYKIQNEAEGIQQVYDRLLAKKRS